MEYHRHATAVHDAPGLLAAIAAGQREAVTGLYDRYHQVAYALAMRMLGDAASAQDCVEAVFVDLWRQRATLVQPGGDVAGWLLARVHGYARERQRATVPPRPADGAAGLRQGVVAAPIAAGVASTGTAAALLPQVRAALATLDGTDRAVLEMAYFDGLTVAQIAGRLAVSAAVVAERLSRGLRGLSAALASGRTPVAVAPDTSPSATGPIASGILPMVVPPGRFAAPELQ